MKTIPLFAFSIFAFMCSTKLSLTSSNIPRRWRTFSLFIIMFLKDTYVIGCCVLPKEYIRACLQESGLNSIFHWCAHWDILVRSLLNVSVVTVGSRRTEKNDVLSAISLTSEFKSLGKSFIYTKKNKRARIEL